jgi:hypothetical protein
MACTSTQEFAGDEKIQPARVQIHVSSANDSVQGDTAVSCKRQHCVPDSHSQLSFHFRGDVLVLETDNPTNAGSAFKWASDARVSTPRASSGAGMAKAYR